ncbi:Hypothetical predicted protein, partial [Marmota monax]
KNSSYRSCVGPYLPTWDSLSSLHLGTLQLLPKSPTCTSLTVPGDIAQALKTADSTILNATALISENIVQCYRLTPPTRLDTPLMKAAAFILGHLHHHL